MQLILFLVKGNLTILNSRSVSGALHLYPDFRRSPDVYVGSIRWPVPLYWRTWNLQDLPHLQGSGICRRGDGLLAECLLYRGVVLGALLLLLFFDIR